MHLLFYFPSNAWFSSVVVYLETHYSLMALSVPLNRDPQVASSEKEEMICFLDLLSLHFIYFVKSQQ